jgi:cholesterol transport system auxiliary component
MIYRLYPYQMANFAKNRWAAPPAAMLAPLIVESLKNSGHFRAVVRTPSGGPAYRLDTQLLQLEQQFYHHPSEVVLTIQVQLINNRTSRVIFDKRITCVVTAYKNDPYDGVVAANEAVQRVLSQLTAAVVSHT